LLSAPVSDSRPEETYMRLKVILIVLVAAVIAAAAFVGAGKPDTASAAPAGSTVRGAIGGDFDAELPLGAVNGADWGVDVSLPKPAGNPLSDSSIHVNVSHWRSGAVGQVQPTTSDSSSGCTGTVRRPTAPAGKVCIYVIGGDNATNVSGVSIIPGSGASRFGFKLIWDAPNNGDSFIDAVWAYHYP
jgi:hypothetical protein